MAKIYPELNQRKYLEEAHKKIMVLIRNIHPPLIQITE